MKLTHDLLNVPGVCAPGGALLRRLLPQDTFTAREAFDAWVSIGGNWYDSARAYQALVRAGTLPDVGLVWQIAGLVYRNHPDPALRVFYPLTPENWRDAAHAAVIAATNAAHATYAAYDAYGAHAAYAAAAAHAAAHAAVEAVRAGASQDAIIEMIIAAVDAA